MVLLYWLHHSRFRLVCCHQAGWARQITKVVTGEIHESCYAYLRRCNSICCFPDDIGVMCSKCATGNSTFENNVGKSETPSHDDIKAVAHMRIADAAQALGIKEAKLRTLSRQVGFRRWPGRKLSSVLNQAKVIYITIEPGSSVDHCFHSSGLDLHRPNIDSLKRQCRASTAAQQRR